MAEDGHAADKVILIEILVTMERQLFLIVSQPSDAKLVKRSRFRKEFASFFPGPWRQVAGSFERARTMIQKDEVDWQYIEGVGMTGDWLRWKKRFFDETVKEGGVSRFLKVANSILGSLAKAIAPLEIVKEYKENVEAALRYGRG